MIDKLTTVVADVRLVAPRAGARIETNTIHVVSHCPRRFRVAPRAGARIETRATTLIDHGAFRSKSLPVRGRGLKPPADADRASRSMSVVAPPCGGAD